MGWTVEGHGGMDMDGYPDGMAFGMDSSIH